MATIHHLPFELTAIIIKDNYPEVNRLTCKLWHKLTPDDLYRKPNQLFIDALSAGHISILDWIRPSCRTRSKMRAIDLTIQAGQIESLNWLLDQQVTISKNDLYHIRIMAARHGKVNILRWSKLCTSEIHADTITLEAIRHNQIDVLEWIKQKNWLDCNTYRWCNEALWNASLTVLRWLIFNGCLHDETHWPRVTQPV